MYPLDITQSLLESIRGRREAEDEESPDSAKFALFDI